MRFISEEYAQRLLLIANKELNKNYTLEDMDFSEVTTVKVNSYHYGDINYLYMKDNMQLAFTVYVKIEFCPDLTKQLKDFEIERNRERIKLELCREEGK
jgi:hypothetical protein